MSTLFQWNGSITYSFEIERDFGTDYGICCWHTPQHNISLIHQDMIEHNHSEVHWGEWFMGVKKVSYSALPLLSMFGSLGNILCKRHKRSQTASLVPEKYNQNNTIKYSNLH